MLGLQNTGRLEEREKSLKREQDDLAARINDLRAVGGLGVQGDSMVVL